MEKINADSSRVELGNNEFRQELVTFTGAGTRVAGTIFARSVANPTKLIDYVKGGSTDGNGIPCAVIVNDLVATGAGDLQANVLISGPVKLKKLVIVADGDSSNIDGVVFDLLRNRMIDALGVTGLSTHDN